MLVFFGDYVDRLKLCGSSRLDFTVGGRPLFWSDILNYLAQAITPKTGFSEHKG